MPKTKQVNSSTILFDAFSEAAKLTKGWVFLSLIEYGGKRILFDASSNADLFKQNVVCLGITLAIWLLKILTDLYKDSFIYAGLCEMILF